MFKNVKWLLHSYFQERAEHHGLCHLDLACQKLGVEYAIDNVPSEWLENECCVVTHGSKQFVRKINQDHGRVFCPGSYAMSAKYSYSHFSAYYHQFMLNSNYILLPFSEVERRPQFLFDMFGPSIFIRPDSTSKEFTGFAIKENDFLSEINALKQTMHPNPDSICVVAAGKSLESEFRFIIASGSVVTGSEYRWDQKLDIRADVLPEAEALAMKIAQLSWCPDNVFVADIGMYEGNPVLVEINPFSSSGLYACDPEKIIEYIGNAAWKEYMGE